MCKPIHEPFVSSYRVSNQKLPNTDIVPLYGLDKCCLQVFNYVQTMQNQGNGMVSFLLFLTVYGCVLLKSKLPKH